MYSFSLMHFLFIFSPKLKRKTLIVHEIFKTVPYHHFLSHSWKQTLKINKLWKDAKGRRMKVVDCFRAIEIVCIQNENCYSVWVFISALSMNEKWLFVLYCEWNLMTLVMCETLSWGWMLLCVRIHRMKIFENFK